MQWDEPFGWAPTNWVGVCGTCRLPGFRDDAQRLAAKWDATVDQGFAHDGTIREKYNVVSGNANVQVSTGYKTERDRIRMDECGVSEDEEVVAGEMRQAAGLDFANEQGALPRWKRPFVLC